MAGRVRGRGTTAGVVAVCAAVLGMGLGACTPEEEPTPVETTYRVTEAPSTETVTPTPTVTETPALTPEEVNIEAAKQTVVEYYAALGRVGETGYQTWREELAHFWGSDLQQRLSAYYETVSNSGQRTEGEPTLEQFTVSSYEDGSSDGGLVRIAAQVCVDTSSLAAYGASGEITEKAANRFLATLSLEKVSETFWVISSLDTRPDLPC